MARAGIDRAGSTTLPFGENLAVLPLSEQVRRRSILSQMMRPQLHLLLAQAATVSATLNKVVIISRHGERERLNKDHLTGVEESGLGPPLTLQGLVHVGGTGAALRARYLSPACAATGTCLGGAIGAGSFSSSEVRAQSTQTARTLGTAEVLLDALLPPATRPTAAGVHYPLSIESRADDTDYVLRGYANHKCDAQASRVAAWFESAPFRTKAAETISLRTEVGAALWEWSQFQQARPDDAWLRDAASSWLVDADAAVPMQEWTNAEDFVATAEPGPVLSPARLSEAHALAAWVEAGKFGPSAAGSLCGGALLAEVRAELVAAAPPAPRLRYFSAHYPSMLCLLSSLGISAQSGTAEDLWLTEGLPAFGSVLVFERLERAPPATDVARLFYFAGANASGDSPWRQLRLPCPGGECEVPAALLAATDAAAVEDAAAWCAACGTTERLLQCAALTLGSARRHVDPWAVLGVVLLSLLLAGLVVLAAVCFLWRWRGTAGAGKAPSASRSQPVVRQL